jgi:hypothetical protein
MVPECRRLRFMSNSPSPLPGVPKDTKQEFGRAENSTQADTFEHALEGIVHGAARPQAENFAGFALGGGIALHGSRGPSLRIQADYIPDHGGGQWFNDVRFGAGIFFKILN